MAPKGTLKAGKLATSLDKMAMKATSAAPVSAGSGGSEGSDSKPIPSIMCAAEFYKWNPKPLSIKQKEFTEQAKAQNWDDKKVTGLIHTHFTRGEVCQMFNKLGREIKKDTEPTVKALAKTTTSEKQHALAISLLNPAN